MSFLFQAWSRWLLLAVIGTGLCSRAVCGDAADRPVIEAVLVWATNSESVPEPESDKKLEKLDEKLAKNLSILKWKNYYVINREVASVRSDEPVKLRMSKKCELTLRAIGEDRFAMALHGEGVVVCSGKSYLKKGEITALGGESENDSAWVVVFVRKK